MVSDEDQMEAGSVSQATRPDSSSIIFLPMKSFFLQFLIRISALSSNPLSRWHGKWRAID
jgi:hypothetical protein